MDVRQTTEQPQASRPDLGAERAAALAESRRRATADRIRSAEISDARRADKTEEYRAVIADAVGANTKVAITRAPSAPIFLYQAIDQNTGEIVQQWPRLGFVGLSRLIGEAQSGPPAGNAVDRLA